MTSLPSRPPTPIEIMDASESITEVYEQCVDELLSNIAEHWTVGTTETTLEWQARMMAELGAVTDESIRIIAKRSGQSESEIRKALSQVITKSTRSAFGALTEDKAEEALNALRGLGDSTMSPRVQDAYNLLKTQWKGKANLVNANMLNSAIQTYITKTNSIAEEAKKTATKVEAEVAGLATGQNTLRETVDNAIIHLKDADITAFYARNGAQWTPDAYMTMVARTSLEKMAVDTMRGTGLDAGMDVFQVSSHLGARPQCYPWQGHFYSWSNRSGVIHDADGREIAYEPVSVTTYEKEPAGLFGINCGHWPIPVVDYGFYDNEDVYGSRENSKAYENSQRQNELERRVRKAKMENRRVSSTVSDPQARREARERVSITKHELESFEKSAGLKSRPDRTTLRR